MTLWERDPGHEVTRLGRDGGDVTDADVVLVAIPGGAVAEALDRLTGLAGKTVIDATNRRGDAPDGFASNAEFVKSRTGGPTAKSFNVNFASLLPTRGGSGQAEQPLVRRRGSAEVGEQLNRDAGYDPVYTGPLNAARQESST